MKLGTGQQILSFQTWYCIWYGCGGEDYGYVEINDGSGWDYITPDGGYPTPADYSGGSGIDWVYYEFDLSAYSDQVVQVRFHFETDSCRELWGWYVDDVFMGLGGSYELELTPDTYYIAENTGTDVYYDFTLYNTGLLTDTYNLFVNGVDFGWIATIWDATGTFQINEIGPILPGESMDFIVIVSIPVGLAPGVQDWIEITAQSHGNPLAWDTSDITTEADPLFWFQAGPPVQTGFGWHGDYVDHVITIQNTGSEEDVYLPMHIGADWWTRYFTIDLRPDGTWNGIDTGEQTWWIGPLDPGESKSFVVRVLVEGEAPGDFDQATISITSDGDKSFVQYFDVITRTSMPGYFYDDFETAGGPPETFGLWNDGGPLGDVHDVWTTNNDFNSGVNADASYSGTYSMYTSGWVEITSTLIDMEGLPPGGGIASCAIQRGDDMFSDYPEFGDDLYVEYIDENDDWQILDWFFGGGTAGEVYSPLWILPDDALHPRFQLRFSQTNWNPWAGYWHIDDVYIGAPVSAFDITPPTQELFGGPGDIVEFNMQVTNFNLRHPETFTLTADSDWPTTIWDSTGTWEINSIGPLMHIGGTGDFIVRMEIPGDSVIGNSYTGTVYATSQLTGVTDTAALTATHPVAKNLDTGDGYNTIQDAVNMANPGESIFVYSNTLNEFVTIDRPLILIGENRATTIIEGGGFNVVSSNVEISGFTFQNSLQGVGLNYVANCLIHNNNFFNTMNGINSIYSGNNEIYDNFFDQNWNGGVYSEMNGAYDVNFQDDFSINSGAWAYYSSATRTNGYVELTSNGDSQVGQILYNVPITSDFVAEFDFQAGGGDGADGMTMFFYKEGYTPAGGGALGCFDADGTTLGYAVELDNYNNGGSEPSANHIAITQDTVLNHLALVDDSRTEDYVWHHVKVISDEFGIIIFVDDMLTEYIEWSGVTDRTFGGFGFSAGTGGLNNYHRVDNVQVSYGIPVGNMLHDNVFVNNFVGIYTVLSDGHEIRDNLLENNFANAALIGSSGSMVYHNDFIAGPATMINAIDEIGNTWDDGYPSGGNYWSDYVGADDFNGPLQNIAGSDNIGDVPHVFPIASIDNYPQMNRQMPLSVPGGIPMLKSIPYDEAQSTSLVITKMVDSIRELEQNQAAEAGTQEIVITYGGTPAVIAPVNHEPVVPENNGDVLEPVVADSQEEILPVLVLEEPVDDDIIQGTEQVDVNTKALPMSSIMTISVIVISLLGILGYSYRRRK